MLRRCDDQFVDNASSDINCLDHLDSFLIRRRTVYIKGYGSTETQTIAATE